MEISQTEQRHQTMAYTIVMVAEGSGPPGLQFIALYAATTMVKFFAAKGRDVLVVYDDLTHGRRVREALKQKQYASLSAGGQIAVLRAVSQGLFDAIPLARVCMMRKGQCYGAYGKDRSGRGHCREWQRRSGLGAVGCATRRDAYAIWRNWRSGSSSLAGGS